VRVERYMDEVAGNLWSGPRNEYRLKC
jgi:hypothetical protein